MISVIIAGGSGTRLWPLSTPDYPKHLLMLTGERSMLQKTYDRAAKVADKVYVVTDGSHSDHVREQLSELPDDAFVIEPGRRGTASCIIAALSRIAKNGASQEPIVFMHADHHINDIEGFANTVNFAGKASVQLDKLVLLGVEPDNPATGFGYIQKSKPVNQNGFSFVYEVDSFKEKPDRETAQKYVSSGQYLWNMGYFVAPLNVFERTMRENAPELFANYQTLRSAENDDDFREKYLGFVSEPIDTALIEKVPDLLVVPGSFDWMDVGSFADLYEANPHDANGNFSQGKTELLEVENSFVRNDEANKPVAVIGLDNVVVINTPHGILVTRKDLSQKVGDVAKKIQN